MENILEFDRFNELVDELQNEETPMERRTEILVQMKQERGMIHTKFDSDTQKMTKLEETNASIKATNQQLFNQLPPTYVNPNKKEEVAKSKREEKLANISINDMIENS